jgi:hypothetical protein
MGHREAARRTLATYNFLTGMSVVSGTVVVASAYALYTHHHAIKVLGIAIGATWILVNARRAIGRRMKYHFDRVNMTGLIANWGKMSKRSRRERAARIIGKH